MYLTAGVMLPNSPRLAITKDKQLKIQEWLAGADVERAILGEGGW